MKKSLKVNFGNMNQLDIKDWCDKFIKKNKNKIKIKVICNNKLQSLDSNSPSQKIKIKFLILEPTVYLHRIYQMKYDVIGFDATEETSKRNIYEYHRGGVIKLFHKNFVITNYLNV